MKHLACIAALALAGLAGTSQAASNTYVYQFQGQCTHFCLGQASGTLTLAANYVPGTPVGTENFISFALNQNATLIALSADDLPNNFSMSGVLPAASAGPASINADIYYEPAKNSMFIFNTLDSGQWSFMPMNNGGMIDESQHLQGDHGQWTLTALPVPEPHSAAMLLGGLSLLGLATRRRAA